MQSENIDALSGALAKAQAAMTSVPFDKVNPHFRSKYASLAAVIDTIRKPLADNGLSYTQATEIRGDGLVLVTTLRHATGQWVASEYPLPSAGKPQELGSALTYARRYSLSSLACIAADDDDDAEGARANGQTNSAPAPKPSAVKPAPVEAPIDPETGEASPHAIKADDMLTLGRLLIAAVKMSTSLDDVLGWERANANAIDSLKESHPKAHKSVTDCIAMMKDKFTKEAA